MGGSSLAVPANSLSDSGQAFHKTVSTLLGVVIDAWLVFVKLIATPVFRIGDLGHYDVGSGHKSQLAPVIG